MKIVLRESKFTDAAWSTPRSDLDAGAYCSVCLIDENEGSGEKVKEKCKLPIRSRPGAPINKNALRNAASRIQQMKGVSAEAKHRAARRLRALMKQAGIEVSSESLENMAS